MGEPLPLADTVRSAIDDLAGSVDDPDAAVLSDVAAGVGSPLRVAVAGRVNAGKSTMVNALLGQRCAPTDVSDCTRHVTWYSHGDSEHLSVHLTDGSVERRPLELGGTLPTELGVPDEAVDHLEVTLPHELLRGITLIDTPGLSSLDARAGAATRELLALDGRSRVAISQADVLVLVVALSLHEDDHDLAEGYRLQFRGVGSSAANTLAVLTKIDLVDTSGADPMGSATDLAGSMAGGLRLAVADVVPVNTLVAETVECGVLDSTDLDSLQRLSELDEDSFAALTRSTTRFVEREAPVPGARRERLLTHLDLHGVSVAREHLRSGRGAASLTGMLRDHSGIRMLRRQLLDGYGVEADRLKAMWGLSALHRLGYSDQPLGPGSRGAVRDLLEELEIDPALHRLSMHRALAAVVDGRTGLTPAEQDELARLVGAESTAAALGLPPDATPDVVADVAGAGARRWRLRLNSGRLDVAEREVAEQVVRFHELVVGDSGGRR